MRLNSDKIERGHCVILNTFDRPETRLIAVVLDTVGAADAVRVLYVGRDVHPRFQKPFLHGTASMTPVSDFGVDVQISILTGIVSTETRRESVATYDDGRPRQWQEATPSGVFANSDLVAMFANGEFDETE